MYINDYTLKVYIPTIENRLVFGLYNFSFKKDTDVYVVRDARFNACYNVHDRLP